MKRRIAQILPSIAKYPDQFETVDRQEAAIAEARTSHLKEKIERLKREMKRKVNVTTEMRPHVLVCNMKRVMKIIGTGPLIAAINA